MFMKDKYKKKTVVKEGKRKRKKKGKMRKKKWRRDSLDPGGSCLSHFEGEIL